MKFDGRERRRYARMPLSARVTIVEGGAIAYLFTRDLSLGGAGLVADDPFEVGTRLMLEFGVTGVSRLIKAEGVVVRHFDVPEKGFGVKFARFMPHSRARLTKALEGIEKR